MPLVFCLLCTLLIPSALLAGEADSTSKQDGKRPRDFVLTVQGPLLSLRAQEASLTAILAAIGREMAIEVVAYIPAHERITVQFDQLSLAEALQRLHTNYV